MNLKEQIQEWLDDFDFVRDHEIGLSYYLSCNDHDPSILPKLEKENSWSRSKLAYLLQELVDGVWVEAPAVIHKSVQVLEEMPASISVLYSRQDSMKQERSAIHAMIVNMESDDERYTAALRILDLSKEIEKSWSIITEWKRTKIVPVMKSATPSNPKDKLRRLMNIRTSVSKRRKKIRNNIGDAAKLQSEITIFQAEIMLLESELGMND